MHAFPYMTLQVHAGINEVWQTGARASRMGSGDVQHSTFTAWWLLQGSVQALPTPALQAFLHLLPTSALLWLTTDAGPLTLDAAQSSLVPAVLLAVQASCSHPMACMAAELAGVHHFLLLLAGCRSGGACGRQTWPHTSCSMSHSCASTLCNSPPWQQLSQGHWVHQAPVQRLRS